ncbi:MAG: chromosome segregation protein SMC [Lachnospiraceae bacterium]|nr:chromosome segregation protein SMC [Lachnospiraceae bacterium]
MYLKSIEAHGFKAFANKIKLEFGDGITGIVGPNGSGKSNIADAVRWVLGEQSAKQLRGSSMQDVIFSGTENRKPLGFAYVTLTLDNSDHWLPISYDEVQVGRRVYRSGESEYMINGSVCRLRDVQELFYDTGIGKEGYSLIGQGQIDKIVSSKPEDRREIFDEAAGIVKYKRRKSAAEKNLEAEKLNLSRVNDIISEIQTRVGPLEKQYEKAKAYLKLRDELKEFEVAGFLEEVKNSGEHIEKLDEKLAIIERDLNDAKRKFEGSKNEYEAMLAEQESRQELLERTREEKNNAKLAKQEAENDVRVYEEQILALKTSEEHFNARMDSLNVRRKNYEDELENYKVSLEKATYEAEKLKAANKGSIDELNAKKSEIENLMQEESEIGSRRMSMMNDSIQIRAELERSNTKGEQINIRRAEVNAKKIALKAESNMNEKAVNEAKEDLKKLSAEVVTKAEACDELEEKAGSFSTDIHEAQDKAQRMRQQMLVYESKLETVKNLSERYEGYGQAVRRVMEYTKSNSDVCGVAADLITTESDLETAIETALGGNVQNIVTRTQETAKDCIEYLKSNKMGRATFIPLDIVKPRKDEFDSDVFSMKGVIGRASDVVKYDKEYEPAVRYLLGRYLVVDNYENALKVFTKYDKKHFVVTKNGELFAPGGAVSGGAFKNNSNLLGRKREIDELEEALKKAKENTEKLEAEVAEKRSEREAVRENLTKMKNELNDLYVELNTAKINLNHASEQAKSFKDRENELDLEMSVLDKESDELNKVLSGLNSKIADEDAHANEEEKKAGEIARKLAKARAELDELNLSNIEKMTVVNTAVANIDHVKENIARVEGEIEGVKAEEEELLKTRADSAKELQEKQDMIDKRKEEGLAQEALIAKKDEVIAELEKSGEEMSRKNKEFFDASQKLSEHINALDKEDFRLKAQKDRLTESLDGLTKHMWDEYELTVSAAKEIVLTIDPTTVTKKGIYDLRARIRSLGDVNVGAIEEYKETSERYEFLKTQRDDIIKAQKALENIIEELDEDMKKQFLLTFEEVNKRFNTIFGELFGGGSGKLELVEEENVLEAGVRIIAQPPGKKLQNMMQLSGGEKALTAISLLFAILDLKPTPFCLLDEIEAALDDSNVSRFANYLQKLTNHTQFIVITHRRGTMAAADSLYGITMQEKGVSTLVSVNLVESDLK